MAREKGFYAERNLDVSFDEFSNDINNLLAIRDGNADFAIGRSSLLIDKGNGADIIALFATFQRSPFMLMTRAFTGIEKPADLRGLRIMLTQDAENSAELIAMLIQAGLSEGDYIHLQHSFNVDDLISGKTDAISSYLSNEPFKMIQQGIPYNILHPADYGFELYSDILFTSGKLLRDKPELVENFYEASILGWKYAFANISETVSVIHDKYNTQNHSKEALLFEGHELKKLAFDENKNFGVLLPHRFESMAQIYLLTGIIDQKPDLKDFIYQPPSDKLNLTYEEQEYIRNKQSILICVQKDWLPYEQMSDGKYHGIIADFSHLIRDKTGLSVLLKPTESVQQALTFTHQGICDFTTVSSNHRLDTNLFKSKPFINISLSFLSRDKKMDVTLPSHRVAISTRTPCYACIKKIISKPVWLKVDSAVDGLKLLKNNEADSVVASEAHLRYLLSTNEYNDFYLNDTHSINSGLSFGMNFQHLTLLNILNKTINLISQQERDRIFSKWIITPPNNGISQLTYWIVISFILLLTLFFIYRYLTEKLRGKLLKELSETDHLTGISNRRKLLQQLPYYIDMANRYHHSLSLIFFDIDDFKIINDRYGHKTGDRILQEITSLISKNIRKSDIFARWGGEEFILASPESKIDDAEKQAIILLQQIHNHQFNLDRNVTCSFGVTQYIEGESMESFINRADKAMYKAKQEGKNRIDTTEIPIFNDDRHDS